MLLPAAVLVSVLTMPNAGDLMRPYSFTAVSSPKVSDYILATSRRFRIDIPGSQRQNIRAMRSYYARHSVSGSIQYLDGSRTQKAECFLVESREALREWVTKEAKSRSTTSKWISDSIVRIDEAGLTIPAQWIKYEDGIVVTGFSKAVKKIDTTSLRPWLKEATGTRSYVAYSLAVLPDSYREALVKQFEARLFPSLQHADNENQEAFESRTLIGTISKSVVGSLVRDAEEIQVWSRWPDPDDPASNFEARVIVRARKDSDLQNSMRNLRLRKSRRVLSDDSARQAAGTFQAHLRVPKSMRGEANKAMRRVESSLGKLAMGVVAQETLDLAIVIPADESNPSLVGSLGVRPDHKPLHLSTALEKIEHPMSRQLRGASVAAELKDGSLSFIVAAKPDNKTARNTLSELLDRSQRPPLLSFRCDLSRWPSRLEKDTAPNQVLVALERAFDVWSYERIAARQRAINRKHVDTLGKQYGPDIAKAMQPRFEYKQLASGFVSAVDKASKDGDWTIMGSVSLRDQSSELIGRMIVGRSLHELFTARSLLAGQRVAASASTNR